jgi:replicative DNA helicase
LIGSSSLENDADQVLVLDHSRYARQGDLAKSWAILGKNRHGGTGSIPIEWDFRTLTMREGLPHELREWPDRGTPHR